MGPEWKRVRSSEHASEAEEDRRVDVVKRRRETCAMIGVFMSSFLFGTRANF
jgi:hypothetical protein